MGEEKKKLEKKERMTLHTCTVTKGVKMGAVVQSGPSTQYCYVTVLH